VETGQDFTIEITPEAEGYFLQAVEYLYTTHTPAQAAKKSEEILEMAMSLNRLPKRGSIEEKLIFLNKAHRYLVYHVTSRKTIKIIYFIDEAAMKVYITDFFGTEMNDDRIAERS
jgi:plasmid stabilization system protein ParE